MKNKKETDKFFTERDKTLGKLFLLVFLFFVLVLNWNDLSLFLNLRTAPVLIERKLEDFFSRRGDTNEQGNFEEKDEKEENGDKKEEDDDEKEIDPERYCEENRITAPAIGITAPIVETGGVSEEDYRRALDRGVVHFPDSAYPGEKGLTILLGHSAPLWMRDIFYHQIFTEIDKLQEGDKIEICYNNVLTTYIVLEEERGKEIYEIGEYVFPLYPEENKKEIVLMTCWPPEENIKRLGVRGVAK